MPASNITSEEVLPAFLADMSVCTAFVPPRRSIAAAFAALILAGCGSAVFASESLAWLISRAEAAEPLPSGQTFRDCSDICPQMVVVPAGSFTMGSTEFGEGPQRRVTVARKAAPGNGSDRGRSNVAD